MRSTRAERSADSAQLMGASGGGEEPLPTLPLPILEDIAQRAFDVASRSMAARAQLSLVCKCGLSIHICFRQHRGTLLPGVRGHLPM
jgi:hypothetical protein